MRITVTFFYCSIFFYVFWPQNDYFYAFSAVFQNTADVLFGLKLQVRLPDSRIWNIGFAKFNKEAEDKIRRGEYFK